MKAVSEYRASGAMPFNYWTIGLHSTPFWCSRKDWEQVVKKVFFSGHPSNLCKSSTAPSSLIANRVGPTGETKSDASAWKSDCVDVKRTRSGLGLHKVLSFASSYAVDTCRNTGTAAFLLAANTLLTPAWNASNLYKCEEHMAWYILVPFNFKQDSVSELNV